MITPEEIRARKTTGPKIVALTAYDYPTGRLLDESGVDLILVGDSVGMVVLGYPDTTAVTMAEMLHHTRATARGVQRSLLVADLPAGSYATPAEALANGRRLCEAGARAVKLEGGTEMRAQIEALTGAGVPVVAHIGMLPQRVRAEGGYKIKGRTDEGARSLLADARAVEDAGACAVVLELVAPSTTRRITAALTIPTIGIGSGQDCDGQILVVHDLVGFFPWFRPRFVTPAAEVGSHIRQAVQQYVARTRGTPLPATPDPGPAPSAPDPAAEPNGNAAPAPPRPAADLSPYPARAEVPAPASAGGGTA